MRSLMSRSEFGSNTYCRGKDENIFNDVLSRQSRHQESLPRLLWKNKQWKNSGYKMQGNTSHHDKVVLPNGGTRQELDGRQMRTSEP